MKVDGEPVGSVSKHASVFIYPMTPVSSASPGVGVYVSMASGDGVGGRTIIAQGHTED